MRLGRPATIAPPSIRFFRQSRTEQNMRLNLWRKPRNEPDGSTDRHEVNKPIN